MIKNVTAEENKSFYAAVFIFVLLSVILYPFLQYSINPDGISYLTIARKYAAGNFAEAVNGYWGPMFSVLLSTILISGLPELLSARLLQVLLGVVLFFIIRIAALDPGIGVKNKTLLYFVFVPVSLYFVYWFITPDLLLAVITFSYTLLILNNNYKRGVKFAVYCGLLGGTAFLTKSYGLFFFLIHFTVFNLIFFLQNDNKKQIAANYLLGIFICLLITFGWGGILAVKYGKFNLGTSGEINLAFVGPKAKNTHLQFQQRLLTPPNETAISAWEDPSLYPLEQKWNPLNSWDEFKHQVILIGRNSFKLLTFVFFFSPFFILLAALENKTIVRNSKLAYFLLTAVLYTMGYLVLFIETRYIWLSYIIVIIVSLSLYQSYVERISLGQITKGSISALLVFSLLIFPVYAVIKRTGEGKNVYELSLELRRKNISGNFACNTHGFETHYLAYFLNSKYFGEVNQNPNNIEFYNHLKENNIDYFFLWNTNEGIEDGLMRFALNDADCLYVVKIR
jgi:hypothetical protein